MEFTKEITLEILNNNTVQVITDTMLVKENGTKIVIEHHREALTPNDIKRAEEILTGDKLEILKVLWNERNIKAYNELLKESEIYE